MQKITILVRFIIGLTLFAMLTLGMVRPALAVCQPNGTDGPDDINCTGVDIDGVDGGDGEDTITVQEGTILFGDINGDSYDLPTNTDDDIIIIESGAESSKWVRGDSHSGDLNSGNDTITNHGVIYDIHGDSNSGTDNSGNDIIANTGTVKADIEGDSWRGENNSRDDDINNSGKVQKNIYGDSGRGTNNTGNDTITNSGTVGGSIYSDSARGTNNTGNDTITNTGTVNWDINSGGGNDTINHSGTVGRDILAGEGDDQVNLTGTEVGGIIDGGDGADTLNFNMSTSDQTQYTNAKNTIAVGGDNKFAWEAGEIEWMNFETLLDNLVFLGTLVPDSEAQPQSEVQVEEGSGQVIYVDADIRVQKDEGGKVDIYLQQESGILVTSLSYSTWSTAGTSQVIDVKTIDDMNFFVVALGSGQFLVECYDLDGSLVARSIFLAG